MPFMTLIKEMNEKGENELPFEELGNVPHYKTH